MDETNEARRNHPVECLVGRAAADVIEERARQQTTEGYKPEHDDEHDLREIASAAMCYVQHYVGRSWVWAEFEDGPARYTGEDAPDGWPENWGDEAWKPKNPRRDLVRAAALLLAEIERIDRQVANTSSVNVPPAKETAMDEIQAERQSHQAEADVRCDSCGFTGPLADWLPALSPYSDIECPECQNTNNKHNSDFKRRCFAQKEGKSTESDS